MLRRNWGQILLLALPGVVVTFLIIGAGVKAFFPYGWTWPQALLFGAMLSATDPVAVVAVLHEARARVASFTACAPLCAVSLRSPFRLPTCPTRHRTCPHPPPPPARQVGADEKLASVIDGESLVNDGRCVGAAARVFWLARGERAEAGAANRLEGARRASQRRAYAETSAPAPRVPAHTRGSALVIFLVLQSIVQGAAPGAAEARACWRDCGALSAAAPHCERRSAVLPA